MGKVVKIFENEKEKYSGNCYVNTVIFRGKIPQAPKLCSNDMVKFSVQLSNGKDDKTGEWKSPTYANIVAFGDLGQKILKNYKERDEIWLTAKYYTNKFEGYFYHGFIAREVITQEELDRAEQEVKEVLEDYDLPF